MYNRILHNSILRRDTKDIIIFDSKIEGTAINPGQSKEQYITLKSGSYSIKTLFNGTDSFGSEHKGYLVIELFTQAGQRLVSSEGGFLPGCVDFFLSQTMQLKMKISRTNAPDRSPAHFIVEAEYSAF